MAETSSYNGFSKNSIVFLNDILTNNKKEWLNDNRNRYEEFLLQPMRQLVNDLAPTISIIDPQIDIEPKVGRTISKIFRDVRFSTDKSPLRANVWLTFKPRGSDGRITPSFYFDLSYNNWSYGMGFYCAAPYVMRLFREKIMAKPDFFLNAVRTVSSNFEVNGENYKRPPVINYPENLTVKQIQYLNPWLMKKSFYWSCTKKHDKDLFSSGLADIISKDFITLSAIYSFLINQ
ncbi:MAG TPA: DUF2461 domain-containing protein [Spirochaetota bacterium]|nr:DUF2461 domain-containing protein [Spirochaetota bacterium]